MEIAAQVSLYPLRQPRLSTAIDQALEVFGRHGLTLAPGPMSTVISGDEERLFLPRCGRRSAAPPRAPRW
jgi:uncharacterized protein YqgV (UPF0045/DUF77 family)